MIIKDKSDFIPMMAKMLTNLGYNEVKVIGKESPIDITAVRGGKNYCFRCRYDIDAIGEKYITELYEASRGGKYDKVVFMTNSSFISSAKKKAEETGVDLWDRNTIDRMYVGISDLMSDHEVSHEKESKKGALVAIIIILVLAALFAVYWFLIRKIITG